MNRTENIQGSQSLAFNSQWLKENLPRYLRDEDKSAGTIIQLDIPYIGEFSGQVTLLYQVEWQDSAHTTRQQIYVGYIVAADQLPAEQESMSAQASIQPPLGCAVALVPEASMVLVAFPNDQKLNLFTAAKLQTWLVGHLHEIANGALEDMAWEVLETKIEILRYVPNKRYTARCRVKARAKTGVTKEVSFIVKQLAKVEKVKRQYHDLVEMRLAWREKDAVALPTNAVENLPVRLPRALARDEENAAIFIEDLPGRNLESALAEIELEQVMPAVGAMLANFHCAQKQVEKIASRAGELVEIHNVIQKIAASFPHLQPRLQRLFKTLESLKWNDSLTTLLHGTFRLNHIFIHRNELALIDFDSMRMGHPAYDLANFLAALYYFEAQGRIRLSQRQSMTRYFIEGYAAQAPFSVPPQVVLWFLVDMLIKKQMHKYIKHFHEDRRLKVERMLLLAETAMAACQNTSTESSLVALWNVMP